jgi:hypothetical protein
MLRLPAGLINGKNFANIGHELKEEMQRTYTHTRNRANYNVDHGAVYDFVTISSKFSLTNKQSMMRYS